MPVPSPESPTPVPAASLSPCRVKICGVTQRDQALAIADIGADFLGLNFWPQSKRYLKPEEAAVWSREVPASTLLVGVFVNAEAVHVEQVAKAAGLAYVQLHGDESPAYAAELTARGLRVIKAIQVRDEDSVTATGGYAVQDVLLDAYHPGQRGGIGENFPWELALKFKAQFPDRALWLAGGLTPVNVGEAVHGVQPYAVDVASGVEDGTPGMKNLEKVRAFIAGAKRKAL